MYFLGVGLVVLFWKISQGVSPGEWSLQDWGVVLAPFVLAIVWWSWADSSGYTKRKAMEREDKRRQARIDKNRDAIGALPRKPRKRR